MKNETNIVLEAYRQGNYDFESIQFQCFLFLLSYGEERISSKDRGWYSYHISRTIIDKGLQQSLAVKTKASRIILAMKSRNVKLILTSSLILICQIFIGYTQGNVYTIQRNRYLDLRLIYSWDSFMMPTSMCNVTSMDGGCGLFDAVLDTSRSCSCYCPRSRTTFAFKGNKWRCVDNSRVRDVQGKRVKTAVKIVRLAEAPLKIQLQPSNVCFSNH